MVGLIDLGEVLVTALEGGINYWAILDKSGKEWEDKPKDIPTSIWAWGLMFSKKKLRFFDAEQPELFYDMTWENFRVAPKIAQDLGYWDGDAEDIDANDADVIVQCAVFGDVVFS